MFRDQISLVPPVHRFGATPRLSVTKRFDATERLTGYVDATEITTFGGKEVLDGVTSRDGHFADSSQSELFGLTGENFDQRAE
jgi:hypothetical protein